MFIQLACHICSRVCFEMYLVVTKHPPFKLAIPSLVAEEEATFDSDGTTGSASTKFQSIHLTYRIAKWCLLYLWCKHYLWCLLYTHNGTEFHLLPFKSNVKI